MRTAVGDVVKLIDARVSRLGIERVPLAHAAGRVLGEAVSAGFAVPPFDRAAMDGYAVRGEETYGADPYTPTIFHCQRAGRPGRAFEGEVGPWRGG